MQAYISQLNHQASQSQAPRDLEIDQHAGDPPTPAEVAIYNEDDLSHLLYVNIGHAHAVAPARDGKVVFNHLQHHDYSTLLEHPSGTHTPLSETNESAILSDCELEDDDLVIPPSPIRPRGGSIDSENIEWPIFLGRQSDSCSPVPQTPEEVDAQATVVETSPAERVKHVRIVTPQDHVSKIEGPLMSWWPAPLEQMEHEWIEMKEPQENTVAEEHHVSYIGGPMMSWWPASPDMMQYEWNERFYE